MRLRPHTHAALLRYIPDFKNCNSPRSECRSLPDSQGPPESLPQAQNLSGRVVQPLPAAENITTEKFKVQAGWKNFRYGATWRMIFLRTLATSAQVDSNKTPYQTQHLGSMELVLPYGARVSRQVLGSKRAPNLRWSALLFLCALLCISLPAREKNSVQYGVGLIVNIPTPVAEVTEAVTDVAGNGIIRGTKEYIKDEYISGAVLATSTPIFPAWKDPGKVFYKVRKAALNPWNFKDSADVGTVAVRYIVQPQGEKNSILRIDALYVEDFRRAVHQSNGSVESSEYKDIQDHLTQMELVKKETEEALREKQEHIAKKEFNLDNNTELLSTPSEASTGESSSRVDEAGMNGQSGPAPSPSGQSPRVQSSRRSTLTSSGAASILAENPNETPEQRVARLRREVQRAVKNPGAPLKSAPFHSASTVKTLGPGTEVLVVILSTYWLGVETHEGAHGWIRRDQLELLP